MRSMMIIKAVFLCLLMWPLAAAADQSSENSYSTTISRKELALRTGDGNRYSDAAASLEARVVNGQLVQLSMDKNTSCRLVLTPEPVAMNETASITGATSGPCMILHRATVVPELHDDQLWLQFKNGHVELSSETGRRR